MISEEAEVLSRNLYVRVGCTRIRCSRSSAHSTALEEAGLASAGGGSGGFGIGDLDGKSATQVYELHCPHATAAVEGFDWARHGRWTALGPRNRAVHVFVVNLCRRPPHVKSHLEANVRNVELVVRRVFRGCFDYYLSHIYQESTAIDITEATGQNSKPEGFFGAWATEGPTRIYLYVSHHPASPFLQTSSHLTDRTSLLNRQRFCRRSPNES